MVNDAGAEVDAITGLKAPTNFGRPNWDRYLGLTSSFADLREGSSREYASFIRQRMSEFSFVVRNHLVILFT